MAASNVMRSVSTWKGGALFEHTPPSGKTYVTDAKLASLPKETLDGPSPMEILLGALTGCTGIDVVNMLTKMRMEIKEFSFEVDTERSSDDPRIFTKIHVTYNIETEPADISKVVRAIKFSVNKYCSVSAILAASAEMSYTLRTAGEERHGAIHES